MVCALCRQYVWSMVRVIERNTILWPPRWKRHLFTTELAVSRFLLKEWDLSTRMYLFLGHFSLQKNFLFVNFFLFPRLTTSTLDESADFVFLGRNWAFLIFHCNFSFFFTYNIGKVPLIIYPDEMSFHLSNATTRQL